MQELSRALERMLVEKINSHAPRWLHHCEELKRREGLGDAKIFVITRRCLAPSWAAVAYFKGDGKGRGKDSEMVEAIAEPTEYHPDIFDWTKKAAGPAMLWQNEPAVADILHQLGEDPTPPLPLDICVAVGGLILSYERVKTKKSFRTGSADTPGAESVATRTLASTIKSGSESVKSAISNTFSALTQRSRKPR